MSLLSSPASRTSPRLVASQPMAYLFIEGNEAKFCLSRPRTTGYGLVKVTFPTVTSPREPSSTASDRIRNVLSRKAENTFSEEEILEIPSRRSIPIARLSVPLS